MRKNYEIPLAAAQRWQAQRFGRRVRIEGEATKSPCPCCGGTDRFKVMPDRDAPGAAYIHCFVCGLPGDAWKVLKDEIRGGEPGRGLNVPRTMRVYKPKPYEPPRHPDGTRKRLAEMTRAEQVAWNREFARTHSRAVWEEGFPIPEPAKYTKQKRERK